MPSTAGAMADNVRVMLPPAGIVTPVDGVEMVKFGSEGMISTVVAWSPVFRIVKSWGVVGLPGAAPPRYVATAPVPHARLAP